MNKIKFILIFIILSSVLLLISNSISKKIVPSKIEIGIALEFVDHSASAHVAKEKGWFAEEGIKLKMYDSYITGMALSAALVRGDIDAAYICLIPAICAYKNGKVDLKIISGTHLYGYALLVDSKKIKTVNDLLNSKIRIGCPRSGSPTDIIMHKMIDKYRLNKNAILPRIQRMPPPKILMALKAGRIDAGFCCEQFPSMGEKNGFKILLNAKDLWPGMQGSVLVVKNDLIKKHPDIIKKLIKVTKRGLDFINNNPIEASKIVSKTLNVISNDIFPLKLNKSVNEIHITPEIIYSSLTNQMICTDKIDITMIQETIDYMAKLGYVKAFTAQEIVFQGIHHSEK